MKVTSISLPENLARQLDNVPNRSELIARLLYKHFNQDGISQIDSEIEEVEIKLKKLKINKQQRLEEEKQLLDVSDDIKEILKGMRNAITQRFRDIISNSPRGNPKEALLNELEDEEKLKMESWTGTFKIQNGNIYTSDEIRKLLSAHTDWDKKKSEIEENIR